MCTSFVVGNLSHTRGGGRAHDIRTRLQFCSSAAPHNTYRQFALDKVLGPELADVQANGARHQFRLLVLDRLVLDDSGRNDLRK